MATVQVHAPVAPHGNNWLVRHPRPAQHGVPPAEHVWPELTQVAAWQVPNSAPVAMTQLLPLQQSADAVQMPPRP